jgi:hypothetical protein
MPILGERPSRQSAEGIYGIKRGFLVVAPMNEDYKERGMH